MAKRKFIWKREITSLLIDVYEQVPVLYKTNDPEYKNKSRRLAELEVIRQKIVSQNNFAYIQRLSVDDIRSKIHGLRTQYFKELSKIKLCESYEPRLWCFSQLDFLRDSESARQASSNLEDTIKKMEYDPSDPGVEADVKSEIVFATELDELSNELFSPSGSDPGSVISTPLPSVERYSKRRLTKKTPTYQLVKTVPQPPKGSFNKHQEDDISAFGKSIDMEMRKLENPAILRRVKRDIFNLLLDAQEEDSAIS